MCECSIHCDKVVSIPAVWTIFKYWEVLLYKQDILHCLCVHRDINTENLSANSFINFPLTATSDYSTDWYWNNPVTCYTQYIFNKQLTICFYVVFPPETWKQRQLWPTGLCDLSSHFHLKKGSHTFSILMNPLLLLAPSDQWKYKTCGCKCFELSIVQLAGG